MAEERRKTPRKTSTPAAKSESKPGNGKAAIPAKAAAPRKPTSEQREAPMDTNLRAEQLPEELRRQIEEAAYYRAKQRGFEPGHELEDWIEAESEVLQRNGLRQGS